MISLRQFNFINSVVVLSLLSIVYANETPKGELVEIYPVIQLPEMAMDGFHLRHLSVQNDVPSDTGFPTELAYSFRYMEKELRMELRKNTQLLDSNYREIRMDYNGIERGGTPAESVLGNRINCYYHGYLSSDPNSLVAVSACRGLSGMIHAHGQMFSIEPDLSSPAPSHKHTSYVLGSGHLAPHHQEALALTAVRHHLVVHDMENLFDLPASYSHTMSTPTSAVFDRFFRDKSTSAPMDRLFVSEDEHRRLEARNGKPTFCGVDEQDISRDLEPSEDENSARQTAEQREAARFLDQLVGNQRVDGSSVFNQDGDGHAEAASEDTWRGVRLLIANDNALCRRHGDGVEAFSLAIANIVSRIYVQAPFASRTFVKLVGQVTYTTKDPYDTYFYRNGDVSVTGNNGLLNMFSSYQDDNANLPSRTNMQLYSGLEFESTVLGLAGVGTMCDPKRSTAVCQMKQSTHALNAVVSAHEMGHNLGMLHDGSGNTCPKSGYVMASYAGSSLVFSRCSQMYYQRYMSASSRFCMGIYRTAPSINNRAPLPAVPSSGSSSSLTTCGDGIVDAAEQCDCGSSNCTDTDPCCDGLTCRLVNGAQCSGNDACCTSECTVVARSERRMCRASQGECDEEERCDGMSATCPANVFKLSGSPCTPTAIQPNTIIASSGMCFGGGCVDYASQCTSRGLFPCSLGGTASPACGGLYCAPNATHSDLCRTVSNFDKEALNGVPCGLSADMPKQCMSGDCMASVLVRPVIAVWVAGEWETCSAGCGGGVRNRIVQCRDKLSNAVLDNRSCAARSRFQAPVNSEECNVQACHNSYQYGWRTGPWTECDASCGSGYQARTVRCVDLVNVAPVDADLCAQPQPANYQICKVRDCAFVDKAAPNALSTALTTTPLSALQSSKMGTSLPVVALACAAFVLTLLAAWCLWQNKRDIAQ